MKLKHKALTGVKVIDASTGTVEAVFSTLGVIDHDGDVTLPGAFTEGAEVRISAYNHASWGPGVLPVGKGTIHEVGNEAILRGQFFMNTAAGRDTFETVKELGPLGEWSYGFDIAEAEQGTQDGKAVQFLKSLVVHEVSPVLLGAGINTRTLAAKSGMKFSEHIDAVVTDVEQLVTRAADVVTLRAQQGKTLGSESVDSLARLTPALDRLKGLLTPEPAPDDTADVAAREMARALRHATT